MTSPTPNEIKAVRLAAKLTQAKAAEIIKKTLNHWQKLEAGVYAMDSNDWEMFLIKIDKS